ncbi:hypothetical protein ANCDUO_04065 [Ancylostoma duodenale]|uniref:IST1 homolog n=1 Tax=Ancylostoma duodenale TaxID=51022 RepID=A0A0C2D7I3_9BILA|nr:hypothetical protein ANCDUO_04065 [Ancylostoma duodenale]
MTSLAILIETVPRSANKADRARIRVEHIIREDYLVEAFEILEMYCDLLLARFGLIEQMKTLDDGIAEAVISIMWAAPRLATDIAEFKTISDQLTIKYGKPFAEAARANQLEFLPRYMIEIAASAGVPFTPDPDVMRDDEVAQAEKMLIDFKQAGTTGPSDGPPAIPPGAPPAAPPNDVRMGVNYGWNLPPGPPPPGHFPPPSVPPPPPGPGDDFGGNGGHIYEVPSVAPPNYDEYNTPAPNAGKGVAVIDIGPGYSSNPPGMIQLPKIGPNGLPVYPGQDGPTYPTLSQRLKSPAHMTRDEHGNPSTFANAVQESELGSNHELALLLLHGEGKDKDR